ncbi:MAG: response regulator [Candidatus Rokubacteria bacterium]|nr:response regulator [Candidatus Rokubacteria bacterium]
MSDEPLKATVLVADDNPDNVELLREVLEAANYTVVVAYDGDEALLKVAESNPDLIILDVMMPGKDGFEVCRRLKKWEQTRNIPVMMLTALQEVADKVRGIESGADEFLTKPVDMVELQTRVKALVRAKVYRQQVIEKNALLEKILNRYLPEEVVAKVLEDSSLLKLGGVRDFVTVLFADLTGFTTFADVVPPEHVMETLNQTFSRLTKIVADNRGTFDKYLGDGLMAFYGAPIASDNDALNAVRTAVEMREAFQALKDEWGEGPRSQLGLAVGINSGEAIGWRTWSSPGSSARSSSGAAPGPWSPTSWSASSSPPETSEGGHPGPPTPLAWKPGYPPLPTPPPKQERLRGQSPRSNVGRRRANRPLRSAY